MALIKTNCFSNSILIKVEYLAMELMNGTLIVHLKLQAGSVKINGPPMNYASGEWIQV